MVAAPISRSYWPADTSEPVLETTVFVSLWALAERLFLCGTIPNVVDGSDRLLT